MRRPPPSTIVEGRRHEMFKSRLQSRHRPCRLSARLVQQAALLFQTLPRCVRGGCTKTATRAERANLLLMAVFVIDLEPPAEGETNNSPYKSKPKTKCFPPKK